MFSSDLCSHRSENKIIVWFGVADHRDSNRVQVRPCIDAVFDASGEMACDDDGVWFDFDAIRTIIVEGVGEVLFEPFSDVDDFYAQIRVGYVDHLARCVTQVWVFDEGTNREFAGVPVSAE